MTRILLFFAGSVLFLSSCVTNKKYMYLQKDDVNVSGLRKDTVVRVYALHDYEYQIQPEDILSIQFESLTPKEYDFFKTVDSQQGSLNLTQGSALLIGELVDHQGEISYPVVGRVKVSGLTVFEIQNTLQKIADQYLESPVVKVRLINFRLTVLGEVLKEGTITLTNNRVSQLEAIGLAGGLTDLADKKNVKLIRQKNGKAEVQYIDLLSEEFLASDNYYVHQNDVLVVPALKQRPYRKYFSQNLAVVVSSVTLLLLTLNLTQN